MYNVIERLNIYEMQNIGNNEIADDNPDSKEKIPKSAEEIITRRIEEFVISEKRFNKKYEISEEEFNSRLLIIKMCNPMLYKNYKVFLMEKEKFNIERLNYIVNLIINGIVLANGEKRDINLLDYYMCTDLDRNEALAIVKDIPTFPRNSLSDFFKHNVYRSLIEISEKELMKMVVKYEQDGIIVEITEQEKREIIEFLKGNNIPLYENIYMMALRRYRDGSLFTLNSELGIDNAEVKGNRLAKVPPIIKKNFF